MVAHQLADRLAEHSRYAGPVQDPTVDRSATGMDVLYRRLRPIIGARGFHALFIRAVEEVSNEVPAFSRLASARTAEQGLRDLEDVEREHLGQGAPNVLLIRSLEILERMMGEDLLQRLVEPEMDASNVTTPHVG